MYAGKRYSILRSINWSKKYIFIAIAIATIPVVLYQVFDFKWLVIPWQPISLVGIAVSFYLGFKNSSSYERTWEARKIWGGIVNSSRTFTVMSRDFITNHFSSIKLPDDSLQSIHKTVVHCHIAWLHALTYQLREKRVWEHHDKKSDAFRTAVGTHNKEDNFEKLKEYLSETDYNYMMRKGNKASHLLSIQSSYFKALHEKNLIDDFRHIELANMIKEFYTLQGKCERIKNFPFPRQYASMNFFFVWIFIVLLPFGMLNVVSAMNNELFVWLTIPLSVLVSWVFIMMELVGEYSENPFEGLYNDVPITTLARSIEIDIREMLEETDLPEPTPMHDDGTIMM
jgi:putative membrane protein